MGGSGDAQAGACEAQATSGDERAILAAIRQQWVGMLIAMIRYQGIASGF
jgi:hypothetical protein